MEMASFLAVQTKLAIVHAERQVAIVEAWSHEPDAAFRDVFPTFRGPQAEADGSMILTTAHANERARDLGVAIQGSDEEWAARLIAVRPKLAAIVSLYNRERALMERLDPDHISADGVHPDNRYQARSLRPNDLRAALAGIHFLPPSQGELAYGTLRQRVVGRHAHLVLEQAKGPAISLELLSSTIGNEQLGRQGLLYVADAASPGSQLAGASRPAMPRLYFAPMSIVEYGGLRDRIAAELTPRDKRRRRELPTHVREAGGDFKKLFAHWLATDPELTAARAPRIERAAPELSMTG